MLRVEAVTRAFGSKQVLNGIDLNVEQGEIICLLGPSGCGKTTLLRIVAGLDRADTGEVLINESSILKVPVHARDFGLMFQDFALFPHMDVAQNVAFGLRMRNILHDKQNQRVVEVLSLVGLTGFEQRDVTSLSGGERQRVALARSLAPNPRLLMLDEPLGSLDASLRERLVVDLRAIIKRVGLTALYVTHDQHEAFAIADRIAIMNVGLIEQIDTPEKMYHTPASAFVAQFLGLNNLVPIRRVEDGNVITDIGTFQLTSKTESQSQTILLHPDGLREVSPDTPGAIRLTVRQRVFQGDTYIYEAAHQSGISLAFKLPSSENLPQTGDEIFLFPQIVNSLKS